jgi:UDP-glucose 4-epimerase
VSTESPESALRHRENYCGKHVLITGGLGLIGSALARRLVELDAEVMLVDSHDPSSSANLYNIASIRERIQLNLLDVRSIQTLKGLLASQDYLFNLAGQSSHIASINDPLTDLDVNCRAQLTLLEACRDVNPGVISVFASTRQIYGRPEYLPVDERHPLSPVDVNGVGKMAGEALHLVYHRIFGLRASVLRLTNTYGPGMRIKDARQNFIGIWLRSLIEGVPFEVWGGAQRRDLTHVDDVVEAFLLAATCPQAHGHAFNVGGEEVLSLRELAELLTRTNGGGEFRVRDFPEARKLIDIGDYYTDDGLFRRLTGWYPRVRLAQGLNHALNYFREHFALYV